MPKTTPEIKVKSVKARGAKAVLHGDSYDDAYAHAMELAAEKGMTFIHPYDDPDVIAGQGTVAMEILRQYNGDIHAIFVPVGGGGLIAGIAAYVKFVRPEIKVIAVEPDDADCLNQALRAGERVVLAQVGLFADGVAVKQIGAEPFRIARQWVDEVVTVGTDEICAAIKDIFDDTRSVAEPAGALAVAGLKKYAERHGLQQQTLIAIDSGATSISTGCVTSPSEPRSANTAKFCWRWRFRNCRAVFSSFAGRSANATSPSSTTVISTRRWRRSSSASAAAAPKPTTGNWWNIWPQKASP